GHAGLGLWIVKRHVESLGGDVVADNRTGGGACVTITLPIQRRPSAVVHHLTTVASR
ncbi:MAG: ATP-binding protein, partial [Stellaceae bacterium]